MEHKTLKYLRLFIPGFIIIICILPILFYFKSSASVLETYQTIFLGVYPIVAIVLGVFYHIFNFRDRLWKSIRNLIDVFIKEEMISAFQSEEIFFNKLKKETNLNLFINIHYAIVDKNESLKTKAEQIYFNGSLLTTTIDITIIASSFTLVYLILLIFNYESYFIITSIMALVIVDISIWGKSILVKRHFDLVKKQINFYQQIEKDDLKAKLEKII